MKARKIQPTNFQPPKQAQHPPVRVPGDDEQHPADQPVHAADPLLPCEPCSDGRPIPLPRHPKSSTAPMVLVRRTEFNAGIDFLLEVHAALESMGRDFAQVTPPGPPCSRPSSACTRRTAATRAGSVEAGLEAGQWGGGR